MKLQDNLVTFIVMLILASIIVFPIQLAKQVDSQFIELYINNHENLPGQGEADSFLFSFSIKNNKNQNTKLSYNIIEESSKNVRITSSNSIILNPHQEKNFFYFVNQTEITKKVSVVLLESDQKIHLYVVPESFKTGNKKYGPVIQPGIPWDKQDPYVQAYYRYNE